MHFCILVFSLFIIQFYLRDVPFLSDTPCAECPVRVSDVRDPAVRLSLLPRHTESGLYFPFMRGTSPFFPLTHFVRNVLSECVMLGTQLCALLPVCTQRAAIPPPSVTGQSVTFVSTFSQRTGMYYSQPSSSHGKYSCYDIFQGL